MWGKVRDWISACMLVREGMGVALVPESTLPEDLRGLSVVPVTPSLHREFALVCSMAGKSSRQTQTLLAGLSTRRPHKEVDLDQVERRP